MRLWHIDILPRLPQSQLVAQWRELNSIYKDEPNHILINYIYKYPKSYLKTYSDAVIKEMRNRSIAIRSMDKYDTYFAGVTASGKERFPEHNEDYYQICYWNLREKYLRGQKDFTKERFNALTVNFCLRDGCNHYKEICDEN